MHRVRFVNPQKQYRDHRQQFLKTIDDVFSRGDLIMRQDLEKFEKNFAKFIGTKYAIGLNSGTDALSLSMQAAGLKIGDEAITVGHTFMASISCIYHCGAKVKLIDVGKDFNMNPDLIEQSVTKKTKVIEPVHLNGRLCDMEKIMKIAKKHNLIVIEDAAQSIGGKMKINNKWKKAGSFGLTGCFSMYPFKMLGAFGDAGMVVTNDSKIAKKIRLLRYNGEDRNNRKFYYHGYTALLDNVQAALLDVKLKYLPSWIKRRREIAKLYNNGLRNMPEIVTPDFKDSRFFDVWQNYVIRAKNRNKLKNYLDKEAKIETLISWPKPTYKEPVLQPNKIHLPETEKICKEVISLPMYPELTDSQIKYVIKSIKKFYQN